MKPQGPTTQNAYHESGVVTAFVVVLTMALLLVTGLVRRYALAYLAASGETGTVSVSRDTTGDLVGVVVPFSVRSSLLTLAGLPVLRGTGEASARNCQGVVQEENC